MFSAKLTKVSTGKRLDVDEINLIESQIRTQKWCDTNLIDFVRLYHQNQQQCYLDRAIQRRRRHFDWLQESHESGYSPANVSQNEYRRVGKTALKDPACSGLSLHDYD
ncbi:hypothetical protein TNCT_698551 [Trichonephila clavata]|uniref:Uncharacterized protein n=1 Tax=Trichonephila clavata TaxID=2740835 RepID=A0A8X6KKE5_TRICU|nr:hypothetical protein TNCT_698551 [Trichonephila clavata]